MSTTLATPATNQYMYAPTAGADGASHVCGSEGAVMRAMSEAQQLMADSTLEESARDMKESMSRRESSLQQKRTAIYQACEDEKNAAMWRSFTRIASGVLSIAAGAATMGSVAGGGNQMRKATAEGSLQNLSTFTERGFKMDAWNKIGQVAGYVQQGLGAGFTALGEQNGTSYDVVKKYREVEGQMADSDAQVSIDIARRRNGDVADATKRAEKFNEMQLEFTRSSIRTMFA